MADYSLKDDLFNQETLAAMTRQIKTVYNEFDEIAYTKEALEGFPSRELKERSFLLCDLLFKYLPTDYHEATAILLKVVKLEGEERFVYSAFTDYVMIYGCEDAYRDYSIELLGELTKIFSSEFAIRAYINKYPDQSFDAMMTWSTSDYVHQRRLASEGFRPKLPWAKAIDFDFVKATEPLNNLFYDTDRYVTRSVANHLNDVSKIDPDLVLNLLTIWRDSGKQTEDEMTYIINHSLRTLIKKGHPASLEFLGYHSDPNITITELNIENPSIDIGDSLLFHLTLEAQSDENLIIDYRVTYPKANGKTSDKVFKLKKVTLKKGQSLTIKKKHPFKVMTTKKLYTGDYALTLQINGKLYNSQSFYISCE